MIVQPKVGIDELIFVYNAKTEVYTNLSSYMNKLYAMPCLEEKESIIDSLKGGGIDA
jgi:hypothetical protein